MAKNRKHGAQQEGSGNGSTELENSGCAQTPKSAQSEKSTVSSKHTGSLECTTSGSKGSSPKKSDATALTCATYIEFVIPFF